MSAQLTPAPQYLLAPAHPQSSNGLAVAGFILALLGVVSAFIPLVNVGGDILAFVGLVLGVFGLMKSGRKGAGRGLCAAAIILALAAFVISIMVNLAAAGSVDQLSSPVALTSVEDSIASTAPAAPAAATVPGALTSCDVVREALLTGSPADIQAGMLVLIADRTADPTAREYASNYTERDNGRKDMQRMDISLIQVSCS